MDKLFEKIEAIQKQPVHVRRRILFVSTGALSVLAFFLWLSLIPSSIHKIEDRTARIASSTSPFAALLGTVEEAAKGLSGIGSGIKNEIRYVRENSSTTLPKVLSEERLPGVSPSSTTSPKEAEE